MNAVKNYVDDIRSYWNSRAGLGVWAGSRDVLAKQLEMEAIAAYARDGQRILDVGCGNGVTAMELARRVCAEVVGVDYAPEMIVQARQLAGQQQFKGKVRFEDGDVTNLAASLGQFDLIYTERAIINLPDWPSQRAAITGITRLLARGGVYAMCENSQDGLDDINLFRGRASLPKINPPWHNRYLNDAEIMSCQIPDATLEDIVYYSSTYYFLSRVIGAWEAAQQGKEPEYESTLNQLALKLPSLGKFGQGRIWLWRKNSTT